MGYLFLAISLLSGAGKGYCGKKATENSLKVKEVLNSSKYKRRTGMSIIKEKFGEYGGKDVYSFKLDNGGLTAHILNYGGIITKLVFCGIDMVLGRDSMEEYLDNDGYYGALIGRNSNRIEDAEFSLGGKGYKLYANDGKNNLHGGKVGFDKKVWESETLDGEEPALILSLDSPDGDEGFPGNAKIRVTYKLTKDNTLSIHYEGEADCDTVINMTNHTYFNLNGHNSGTVDNHKLWLSSGFYTPNTEECVPCGEILSVNDTPFDFRAEKTLGEGFASSHKQITMFGGFDHNFALDGRDLRLSGRLSGDKSGITMEMYTDCSGVQIYTGNGIDENRVCKDGAVYPKHGAVCLETQAFPNFLKHSHFPGGVLRAGEKYDSRTIYKFSAK